LYQNPKEPEVNIFLLLIGSFNRNYLSCESSLLFYVLFLFTFTRIPKLFRYRVSIRIFRQKVLGLVLNHQKILLNKIKNHGKGKKK